MHIARQKSVVELICVRAWELWLIADYMTLLASDPAVLQICEEYDLGTAGV